MRVVLLLPSSETICVKLVCLDLRAGLTSESNQFLEFVSLAVVATPAVVKTNVAESLHEHMLNWGAALVELLYNVRVVYDVW